jgi:hypothetical protein
MSQQPVLGLIECCAYLFNFCVCSSGDPCDHLCPDCPDQSRIYGDGSGRYEGYRYRGSQVYSGLPRCK